MDHDWKSQTDEMFRAIAAAFELPSEHIAKITLTIERNHVPQVEVIYHPRPSTDLGRLPEILKSNHVEVSVKR